MRLRITCVPLLLSALLATVSACDGETSVDAGTDGGPDGSSAGSIGQGSSQGASGGASGGLVGTGGKQTDIEVEPSTGGEGGAAGSGSGGEFAECAADSAESRLEPVYLVFLLDQSGSMGDGEHGLRAEKWDPVTAALTAFFADPDSAGLYASLSLFPDDVNQTLEPASGSYQISCDAEDYGAPVVPPSPLPDEASFSAAIAAVDPPNEYGTPTQPALAGTVEYAQSLAAEGKKVAIVMVTDGEPAQCGNGNSVAGTASVAASVAETIPTYVIGVGSELGSLNSIAEAGGTEAAFIVDTEDPETTRSELLSRIQVIRGDVVSCDLLIPDPPMGQTLDPQKVNVSLATTDSEEAILGYDPECGGGQGWRYDDEVSPTFIELCPETCELIRSAARASVDVVFGCETRTPTVK